MTTQQETATDMAKTYILSDFTAEMVKTSLNSTLDAG